MVDVIWCFFHKLMQPNQTTRWPNMRNCDLTTLTWGPLMHGHSLFQNAIWKRLDPGRLHCTVSLSASSTVTYHIRWTSKEPRDCRCGWPPVLIDLKYYTTLQRFPFYSSISNKVRNINQYHPISSKYQPILTNLIQIPTNIIQISSKYQPNIIQS